MDHLPVELLYKILALASFDDGATGRSLALTSKLFADIGDSVRFEAVSLCGTFQIIQFAAMLERFPDRRAVTAGNIRHLFVSGRSRREAQKQKRRMDLILREIAVNYELIAIDSDQNEKYKINQVVDEQIDSESEDELLVGEHERSSFHTAARSVLRYSSPSLLTLFIITPYSGSETFPPFSMPNLTDLSVTFAYTNFATTQTYPTLKRFHIDLVPIAPCGTPINLRTFAPALEELTITDMYNSESGFLDSLSAHACCLESVDKDNSASELLFPDTIRRVLLQPCPPPYRAHCGTPYQFHDHFIDDLIDCAKSLAETEHRRAGGFRVVLLEAPTIHLWCKGRCSGLRYSFEDARRDWTDVLLGEGRGRWDDTDRDSRV